jgi:hypothetical protein
MRALMQEHGLSYSILNLEKAKAEYFKARADVLLNTDGRYRINYTEERIEPKPVEPQPIVSVADVGVTPDIIPRQPQPTMAERPFWNGLSSWSTCDSRMLRHLLEITMWNSTTHVQHSRCATRYQTDLTENEWQLLQPMLPAPHGTGRPRNWAMREIVNASSTFYAAALPGACCRRICHPSRKSTAGFRAFATARF